MTKIFAAAVVAALVATFNVACAEEVVTLTEADFQQTIEDNQYVLAEFYAPWCGHCKQLAPEYEKAAAALKDYEPKVVLAKIDATAEESLAQEFEVQGFPTLIWFNKGKQIAYGGGRTESEIVAWVKKKTGPPAVELADAAAFNKFKEDNEIAVVGVFKDAEQAATFIEAADANDDVAFAVSYGKADVEAAAEVTAPSIVLFRNFDEPRVVFEGDITAVEEIDKFVLGNELPLIIPFNQDTAQKVFGGDIMQHLLIFVDESKSEEKEAVYASALPVAKKKQGEMLVVSIDKSDDRILEFFGIGEGDVPTARIVENIDDGMKKYKYEESEVTEDGLTKFVDAFEAKELAPDLKSAEPLDESEQGDVFVVVGKNFEEVVNRPGVGVLVEFYAPWCGHCKKLEPEYEALGKHYKDNEKVLIAKMDATENEVERVQIQGFPTIKYFPADSEEIIDFDGDRTTEGMKTFIEEQLSK